MTEARSLPTGTVTFLRTDVEGSMRLVRDLGPEWDAVNAAHIGVIRTAVDDHGGVVVRTEGDAVFAAFDEAGAAAAAAIDAQRALRSAPRLPPGGLPVRMGLHSGEAHRAGDDYGGFDVSRAARIAAAGHGGQVVVSETTAALIVDQLPPGARLDDLGSHRLRDVPRPVHLWQLTVADLPSSFPPLRTAGTTAGNLPDRLTSFVGRDEELDEITALARAARLITLTGPGGIGKTSLATEVARALAPDHPDGAWFASLADVTDAAEVSSAVAHAIGLFDGPERSAATALLPYLRDRSMVVVLDNFEQLLEAADQVAQMVQASSTSRWLVTSRAPLHLAGERDISVTTLDDDAVQLFVDRAHAVRPDWELGGDEPVVAEICALVDDLPLGVELAAARVNVLPPSVIRDRLVARLPLPGPGSRNAPSRQRTLDATVSWSHDLLPAELQTLLHELSVFEGGFDAEQVAAVSPGTGGDRLDDLVELADRSLIMPVRLPGGRARFRMLRTIQSFALAKLAAGGREDDVRRRHAEAFAVLAAKRKDDLNRSTHVAALDRMEPEMPNLRTALRWAIDREQGELALRLVGDLWRFWQAFGLVAQGRQLTEAALAMPSAPMSGSVRAWAVAAAGSLAYWQADVEGSRRWYKEQVEVARDAGDKVALADAIFNIGHVLFIGHADEATQSAHLDEVLERFREIGDERGFARAFWSRGLIALVAGRVDEAEAALEMGLAEFARNDDPQYHAMTLGSLGWVAFTKGDVPKAARRSVEALVETHRMRDLGTTTISLHIGVLMAAMLGRFVEGAELNGAFDANCERYGVRPPAALAYFIENQDPFAAIRAALPTDVFAAAYERGRRMSLDEAVAKVVELADGVAREAPAGIPISD